MGTALGIGIGVPFGGASMETGAQDQADTPAPGAPDYNVLSIDFTDAGTLGGLPSAYVREETGAYVLWNEYASSGQALSIDFTEDGTPGGPSALVSE